MAANKRIKDTTLPNNFKQDGEILYGSDLNQVISILKAGVNANKADLDKLLTGITGANVVYSIAALNDLVVHTGDKGFVYNPEELGDGINVYIFNGSTWVFSHVLSLEDIFQNGTKVKTNGVFFPEDLPEEEDRFINLVFFDTN